MSSLQEVLVESMLKDFENIKQFEIGKSLRKEYSLLSKRIESAKKLLANDNNLLLKVEQLELKMKTIKL